MRSKGHHFRHKDVKEKTMPKVPRDRIIKLVHRFRDLHGVLPTEYYESDYPPDIPSCGYFTAHECTDNEYHELSLCTGGEVDAKLLRDRTENTVRAPKKTIDRSLMYRVGQAWSFKVKLREVTVNVISLSIGMGVISCAACSSTRRVIAGCGDEIHAPSRQGMAKIVAFTVLHRGCWNPYGDPSMNESFGRMVGAIDGPKFLA